MSLYDDGLHPSGLDFLHHRQKAGAVKRWTAFIVSVDPKGELAFPLMPLKKRPTCFPCDRGADRTSAAGISGLFKKLGISYVFAGVDRLDCTLLLKKLYSLFGIEKLMVAGGV